MIMNIKIIEFCQEENYHQEEISFMSEGYEKLKKIVGKIVKVNRARSRDEDSTPLPQEGSVPDKGQRDRDFRGKSVEDDMWTALKTCYDPDIPINIVDLGLIYGYTVVPEKNGGIRFEITMTLTSPNCEMGQFIVDDVYRKLRSIPDVTEVDIALTFDPPWDRSMMSDAARLEAGISW
jgi:metal-sulfur cluster biosynthetic enzyme